MPLFLWKPSYELGIPEIDDDHRQLFEMINELYAAMKDGRGQLVRDETIEALLAYVDRHFTTEESFMRLCRYPSLAEHEQAHRAFLIELQAMAGSRSSSSPPTPTELLTFLCDWIRYHVTVVDQELAVYLKNFRS